MAVLTVHCTVPTDRASSKNTQRVYPKGQGHFVDFDGGLLHCGGRAQWLASPHHPVMAFLPVPTLGLRPCGPTPAVGVAAPYPLKGAVPGRQPRPSCRPVPVATATSGGSPAAPPARAVGAAVLGVAGATAPPPGTPRRRPVVLLPGLGCSSADYAPLAATLTARGHPVTLARVARWEWSRNAAAITTAAYWSGTLTVDAALPWYLTRITEAVAAAVAAEEAAAVAAVDDGGGNGVAARVPPPAAAAAAIPGIKVGGAATAAGGPQAPRVHLVAHSAAGWIARHWLGAASPRPPAVASLTTLGTPHVPPPAGALDQSRGLLASVAAAHPGAAVPGVRYTSVVGDAVTGGAPGAGLAGWLAFASYAALGGGGAVAGDGVVSVAAADLGGGELRVLPGVTHVVGGGAWYGAPEVVERWATDLD